MRIKKPDDFLIKTNLLENRYVTDGIIWTVDETIFNQETKLFLVISLNTKAILGYIQGRDCRNEDLIIELYQKILDEYEFPTNPCLVHSDMEESYHSEKVQTFLGSKGIYISVTEGLKYQNQVSESINNRIKYLAAEISLEKTNPKAYREFVKSLPDKLRVIHRKAHRCQDRQFRKLLFESQFFKNQRQGIIQEAILRYNKSDFIDGITREEAQYYDSFVEGRTTENTRLVHSKDILANMIQSDNAASIQEVKTKVSEILASGSNTEEKINAVVSVVVQRQDSTTELMKQGFIGLALQNEEINEELKEEIFNLQEQLKAVTEELQKKYQQEQLILERREKRRNQKRLPLRDPITEEIYEFFVEKSVSIHRETYYGARLRLALALLLVTGVRISELLHITVEQVSNLYQYSWIRIDRMKRGPSNHKAFLTRTGTQILRKRARDFEIIQYSKEHNSFVFTPQYSKNPLERAAFTKIVNKFLRETSNELPDKPNITSHSFRSGFITKLWRDTNDIEFVRQAIGHAKIDTTSRYVHNLTEEERKQRMIEIQTADDLFY